MDVIIEYPVFLFCHGNFMLCKEETLKTSTEAALKRDQFSECFVVDSNGTKFLIEEVRKIGYVPPLWGWRLLSSRRVKVDLKLQWDKQLSLQELKDLLLFSIDKNFEIWDEGMESAISLKQSVQISDDYQTLMSLFPLA